MNILIAPNSFRGSLDAFQVADIIGNAFQEASSTYEITKIPVADGGDFTGDVLLRNLGGEWKTVEVLNPLGQPITARLGITNDHVGIVELSEASGTRLIKESELNPMITTTYGTGQLIKAALDEGCQKIIVGLGGSATNDAGVGLLQALGVRFLDKNGQEVGFGGQVLGQIEAIDESGLDPRLADTKIVVPCDVHNYVLGEKGASKAFARQKGADKQMIDTLEENMTHYSLKIWEIFRRDIVNLKFGGAAGGTASGLWAFLDAGLVLGSRYILNELNFDKAAEKADLIITAEGKLDNQTINGKAPFEVAIRGKRFKKTVIAIAGQTPSIDSELFHATFSIVNRPMSLESALQNAEKLLYNTSFQIAKLYKQLMRPKPKPKAIEKLLVINADIFDHTTESLEQIAFALSPLKAAEIPVLLYSNHSKSEMIWLCEQLAIHAPFIIENGSALYVPNDYLKLELKGFSQSNDDYQELAFGSTKETIKNVTYKLAKITGLSNLDEDIQTPLDLADYLDIEIPEAERIMARKFSQMIIKTEETPPINDMFRMLVGQQGLQIMETNLAYYIGSFDYVEPLRKWLEVLKLSFPDLKTFGLSNISADAPIFELCDTSFLLKKGEEWQPLLMDELNLINGSGSVGLKQVLEIILKEKHS